MSRAILRGLDPNTETCCPNFKHILFLYLNLTDITFLFHNFHDTIKLKVQTPFDISYMRIEAFLEWYFIALILVDGVCKSCRLTLFTGCKIIWTLQVFYIKSHIIRWIFEMQNLPARTSLVQNKTNGCNFLLNHLLQKMLVSHL